MPMIEPEPTPIDWLAERLPSRFAGYASDPLAGRWYSSRDLLDGDAAVLHGWHARLVTDGSATLAAAATYLVGWVGGSLAGAIGHALATVDAGFLVDATVRWHEHPGGWMDRVDLGRPGVVVGPGHPWAGQAGVTVVEGDDDLLRRTVDTLVSTLNPLVDACSDLGRTGRSGLWNEVADGLGLSVTHQTGVPTRVDVVDTLARAVRTPGSPWGATPTLRIVDTAAGPAYIGQKGGCCLTYTCPAGDAAPEDYDDDYRAFLDRFPDRPGERRYCSTCKFRDPLDSERRQRFWMER